MYSEPEQRNGGIGGAVFAGTMIALMGYLTFAALQGEYGLFRLFQIEAQANGLQDELTALQAQRASISNKARQLSTGLLNKDLLDEQARNVLGLGRLEEVIIR